ncbi:hypothetical protein GCM10010289_02030 [Streptomyces violascens]|uniref:Lipoprotein n=1 Tax=Streptomyces violascens TaxID=67381 RepID=A0ABQ3QF12_9ACTN|nr:hypothetical protein GCM10010289_02030 [Streptomyces violascens]GHI35868.1 hypothetical protein Sviol_02760 [Streptomyces violascens]
MATGAVLLCGCGPLGVTGRPRPNPTSEAGLAQLLDFHYVGDSGENETMNQQLVIKNNARRSQVPTLSFTAFDKNKHVLPQVRVTTVYGSDHGNLVAPFGSSYDVLRFSGPGEHDVADVRVAVRRTSVARIPAGPHDVTTQALDSRGKEIPRFERFSAVRLTNEDDVPVSVRVVYILWDRPPNGVTQQAVEVTPVGALMTVPAHGTTVLQVDTAAAKAVARNSEGPAVSIKAYNSQ